MTPAPLLIALAYIGFVSLGLPDAVLGVAWPSVRNHFDLRQDAVGLVFLASGFGYFATSFFAGRLVQSLGIGRLLALSTMLVAASAAGFALAPVWPLFVVCGVLHGLGSGAIDAGLNGYAAHHLSAKHMNWLHACYCFGAMLGPLLMTQVLTGGATYSVGYGAVAGVMLTLAGVFTLTGPLWGTAAADDPTAPPVGIGVVLRHPVVRLQMAVFFLYTGFEVAVSQWTFTVLTEARGVPAELAGRSTGLYWACIGVGRVAFGMTAERIGLDLLVRGCLVMAVIGAGLFAAPLPIEAAVVGLVLMGIGLAPVYPCLMTRTPQRLGPAVSAHAVGFQVGAAMIGAAAVPAALGVLAGAVGVGAVPAGVVAVAVMVWGLHEWLVRAAE